MKLTMLTPEKLPAVLDLVLREGILEVADLDFIRYRSLEDPTCLPDLLLVAEDEGGALLGLAFGLVRGDTGTIKLFGVARRQRRQGIGTILFDEIEARLKARGVSTLAVAGVPPIYYTPGVDLRHTDAIAFLLARGYETNRAAQVDMAVQLSQVNLETAEDEARLAREGIAVRRATAAEAAEVAAFAREHFHECWERETADAARFAVPPLFVAWKDGKVVSFAAYDTTGPARFGPTGTLPECRRRGIGGVLLKRCLRAMRERGDEVCQIGWAGPLGYYARAADARISNVYWIFSKPAQPQPQP